MQHAIAAAQRFQDEPLARLESAFGIPAPIPLQHFHLPPVGRTCRIAANQGRSLSVRDSRQKQADQSDKESLIARGLSDQLRQLAKHFQAVVSVPELNAAQVARLKGVLFPRSRGTQRHCRLILHNLKRSAPYYEMLTHVDREASGRLAMDKYGIAGRVEPLHFKPALLPLERNMLAGDLRVPWHVPAAFGGPPQSNL
jgi:hypothetical protein